MTKLPHTFILTPASYYHLFKNLNSMAITLWETWARINLHRWTAHHTSWHLFMHRTPISHTLRNTPVIYQDPGCSISWEIVSKSWVSCGASLEDFSSFRDYIPMTSNCWHLNFPVSWLFSTKPGTSYKHSLSESPHIFFHAVFLYRKLINNCCI